MQILKPLSKADWSKKIMIKILVQIGERLKTAFNLKQNKSEKNQPNGYAGLDADGKILENAIPSKGITSTYPVGSVSDMLNLKNTLAALTPPKTIEEGDVAVVSDPVNGDKSFILSSGDPEIFASWIPLKFSLTSDSVLDLGNYNDFVTAFEAGLE